MSGLPTHHFKLESAPSARILSSRSLQSTSSDSSRTLSVGEQGDSSLALSSPGRNSWACNNSDNVRRQVGRSQSTTSILTLSEPCEGRRGRLTFTTSTGNLKRAGSSRGMRTSLCSTDEFSTTLSPPPLGLESSLDD